MMAHDSPLTSKTCIRAAHLADAAAIAAVHVASWRETYAGLLPQDILDALSVPERTARWERMLGDGSAGGASVFVAECGGEVTGFASGCRQRDDDLRRKGFTGEFSAIYVLKRAQRRGLGRS